MHTSTDVDGTGTLPSTSSSLKLVGGGDSGERSLRLRLLERLDEVWKEVRKGWGFVAVCDARLELELIGTAGREERKGAVWMLVLRAHMRVARRPFWSRNDPRIVAIRYVEESNISFQGTDDIGVVERSLA
jgi:hypothetical protein